MTEQERQTKISHLIVALSVALIAVIAFSVGAHIAKRDMAKPTADSTQIKHTAKRFTFTLQGHDNLVLIVDTKTGSEYLYRNGAMVNLNTTSR